MEINIQKSYLQGLPNQQATPHNGKRIIIIHNTATPEATARNEGVYFNREWQNIQTFVHAFADWNGDVVELAPYGLVAWGAGYVNKYAFLQVEQCISNDAQKNRQSAEAVAQYVAKKIRESGVPFSDYRIIDHATASVEFGGSDHMDSIVGVGWADFINRIQQLTTQTTQPAQSKPQTQPAQPTQAPKGEPAIGVFRCGYNIKARTKGPDKNNPQAYLFRKGDAIRYDRRLIAGGYEWISQRRANGDYWYIPVRDLGDSTFWGDWS